MFVRLRLSAGLFAFALALVVGCGKSADPARGTVVSGVVKVKGKPAGGVMVNFHGENNAKATANTDAEGKYSIEVTPGPVKVSLTSVGAMPGGMAGGMGGMPGMPGAGMPGAGGGPGKTAEAPKGIDPGTVAPKTDIPAMYSKPDTSKLAYTIQGTEQTVNIDAP
jgi:hypothetical protein